MDYLIPFVIIAGFLIIERTLHERRLRRIPIRVLVNGIRGKSTVTRLIASALSNAGIPTLAKITGKEPLLILPDGREEILKRLGPPRIQEQIRFIKKAVRLKVGAVVVECMALDREYQAVSELRMTKSNVGVITNVRPDHYENMGGNLHQIAETLSHAIPRNGALVTADQNFSDFFKKVAESRQTRSFLVSMGADSSGNENTPFMENLCIAREVCRILEVRWPADAVARWEKELAPQTARAEFQGKKIVFVDGFSANDTVSAEQLIRWTVARESHPKPFIVLLNNRSDRPLRMQAFIRFLTSNVFYDRLGLMGDNVSMARRLFRSQNRNVPIVLCSDRSPTASLEKICRHIHHETFTIIGLGNYKGSAGQMAAFFEKQRRL
jgi:poly-gamma-glutamate synthase PgsB/CapB